MTQIMSMVNDMQKNPDTLVPIFIKIAPDITQEMKMDIAEIITNSTVTVFLMNFKQLFF